MMVATLPKRFLLGDGCGEIHPMNDPAVPVAFRCHHMTL